MIHWTQDEPGHFHSREGRFTIQAIRTSTTPSYEAKDKHTGHRKRMTTRSECKTWAEEQVERHG